MVAGSLFVAACANTVEQPGPPAVNVACAANPQNPDAGKVYAAPQLAEDSPARCNIETMAMAVHNEGEFRTIYGKEEDNPAISLTVGRVIKHLGDQAAALTCPASQPDCTPVFKILIFAHGGLVSHKGAVLSAEALAPGMIADGYAPVFLVWNSDFVTAYGNRLCCVLDGEKSTRGALYFAPVRLLGDVTASLARAPEYYGQQAIRFRDSVIEQSGTEYYLQTEDVDDSSSQSLCASLAWRSCPKIIYPAFPDSTNHITTFEHLNGEDQPVVERRPDYILGGVVRAGATAILPQAAAEAWDNMVRRTRLALEEPLIGVSAVPAAELMTARAELPTAARAPRADDECEAKTLAIDLTRRAAGGIEADRFRVGGQGAFAIFFDRLACEIQHGHFVAANDKPVRVELYYFGHSMGALVGNELLARYPDLPWRRVVYMAAATPVRDFKLMVAPILAQSEAETESFCGGNLEGDCRGVWFYSLMLHPLAESHESEGFGFVPEGSLLEWVDEMFNGPKTVDDRMLGKWTNAEKAMRMFPAAARERMVFRVFPAQAQMRDGDAEEQKAFYAECTWAPGQPPPDRCHPLVHGDFSQFSFWRDDFLCGPGACPDADTPSSGGRPH